MRDITIFLEILLKLDDDYYFNFREGFEDHFNNHHDEEVLSTVEFRIAFIDLEKKRFLVHRDDNIVVINKKLVKTVLRRNKISKLI